MNELVWWYTQPPKQVLYTLLHWCRGGNSRLGRGVQRDSIDRLAREPEDLQTSTNAHNPGAVVLRRDLSEVSSGWWRIPSKTTARGRGLFAWYLSARRSGIGKNVADKSFEVHDCKHTSADMFKSTKKVWKNRCVLGSQKWTIFWREHFPTCTGGQSPWDSSSCIPHRRRWVEQWRNWSISMSKCRCGTWSWLQWRKREYCGKLQLLKMFTIVAFSSTADVFPMIP